MPTTKVVLKLGEFDDTIKKLSQELGVGDRTSTPLGQGFMGDVVDREQEIADQGMKPFVPTMTEPIQRYGWPETAPTENAPKPEPHEQTDDTELPEYELYGSAKPQLTPAEQIQQDKLAKPFGQFGGMTPDWEQPQNGGDNAGSGYLNLYDDIPTMEDIEAAYQAAQTSSDTSGVEGGDIGDGDSTDEAEERAEGEDRKEEEWKNGWLKPWPKEWKDVDDPGVNNYNVQIYHASMDEIQALEEGEMYFVEASRFYGPLINGVYGEVILFDQDKYCVYEYKGVGVGKSAIALEGMSTQGIVKNVYEPEDFQGPFINGSAVTATGGISGSIGYDFKDGRPVTSFTQGATSSFAFSLGGAVQYFYKISDGWIYEEAPIKWQEPLWSMPSGNFDYYAQSDESELS